MSRPPLSRQLPISTVALALCTLAAAFGCSSSGSGSSSGAPVAPDVAPPPGEDTTPPDSIDQDDGVPTTATGDKVSSGGKGGLACARQDDLGGGRKSCVVKLGSVEVKFVVGAGGTGPLRLGLYLHGDGAAAHNSNSALKAMIGWADTHHGLGVSVLAPNGCSWWQSPTYPCTGDTDPDDAAVNAQALVGALGAITKAYDIRGDGVRYYGSSGGSIFLTDEWIPLQGASYPGVFAIMCGGDPPRTYAWDADDASLVARNRLWFTYGDQDSLVPNINASIAAFKNKSFQVTAKVIPNAGHCEFDAHAEAVGIWSAAP
jgi:hypothetical protein